MALKFFWRCEAVNLTADVDYSGGDTTGTNSASFTFDAAAARVGTNGIVGTSATAGAVVFDAASIWPDGGNINSSVGSVGFWVRYPTALPTNNISAGFRAYATTTGNRIALVGYTGDKLAVGIGGSGYFLETGASISLNTWYFVVIRFDFVNDKLRIELYDTDGVAVPSAAREDLVTDLSAEITSGTTTAIRCADRSTTAGAFHFDNYIISDNYDADLVYNALITDKDDYNETGTITYLKLLTAPSAESATGVEGWVVSDDNSTYYGYFSGQAFETGLEGGEAVLLVDITDISPDGGSLTTSDTPLVVVRNASDGTTMCDCTVVEV